MKAGAMGASRLLLTMVTVSWLSTFGGAFVVKTHIKRNPTVTCGVSADSVDFLTAANGSIEMDASNEDAEQLQSDALSIPIIYESSHVLVIDKPCGIPHHDDAIHTFATNNERPARTIAATPQKGILSLLRIQLQKQRGDQSDKTTSMEYGLPKRLYGVHRLDKVTSGILIFAKSAEMARYLTQQFRDKTVVKYYVGLSSKKPKSKKQGWVKGEMVRSRNKSWMLLRNDSTASKKNSKQKVSPSSNTSTKSDQGNPASSNQAVTRFFTAGMGHLITSDGTEPDCVRPKTCILFRPFTGKTHQLRVAAKSVGLSLFGDPTYSSEQIISVDDGARSSSDTATADRCYLHAAGIHVSMSDFVAAATEPDIVLWSPPPFEGIAKNGHGDAKLQNCPVNEIIMTLMMKHCKEELLLEAASQHKLLVP